MFGCGSKHVYMLIYLIYFDLQINIHYNVEECFPFHVVSLVFEDYGII